MQRNNDSGFEAVVPALDARRRLRRFRAFHKVAGRRAWVLRDQAAALRGPLRSAGLLALVGLVLFSPLLLDDIVFRASYLMRPSEDTITIGRATLLSDLPGLKLAAGTLSMPPALSGKARTGEALAALVKGGSARLALRGPVLVLDMTGRAPWIADPSVDRSTLSSTIPGAGATPLIGAMQHGAFETLAVRDGTLVLDFGDGNRVDLTDLQADVGIKRRTAIRIKGSATLRGEPIRFDVVLGARIDRRGTSRLPVKGRIESAIFQVNIDGRIALDDGISLVDTTAEIALANVRSVARWLGHAWPSGPGLRDFLAKGTLSWSQSTLALDRGRFWLDGSDATGTIAVSFQHDRPLVAGTLAYNRLDLSPYFTGVPALVPETTDLARVPLLTSLKGAQDVRWPLIGFIDADLRMSAEQVRLGTFEAGRTAASLALRDGQMLFNVAEILFPGGGRGVGEFAISGPASYPNFDLRGRLEEVDLARVSNGLVGLALVRGLGDFGFEMAGSGSSGLDVLSRLQGKLTASLPDGGILGCSHRAISAAARASRRGDICSSGLLVEPAQFAVTLVNGVVEAKGLEASGAGDDVALGGTVDLVTSGVDVTIKAGPRTDGDRRMEREQILVRGRADALNITVMP